MENPKPITDQDREIFWNISMRAQKRWGLDEMSASYLTWRAMVQVWERIDGDVVLFDDIWAEMNAIQADPSVRARVWEEWAAMFNSMADTPAIC